MNTKTPDVNDILEQLKLPFKVNQLHWRVGSITKDKSKGMALAYIDARDVMKRLDDVLGIAGWQSEFTETASGRVICRLGIRINNEWIWKSDGAGETAVEGEKGAISDALKRAAVNVGIGRYLYYLDAVWVDLDKWKKIIKPPALPDWAKPRPVGSRDHQPEPEGGASDPEDDEHEKEQEAKEDLKPIDQTQFINIEMYLGQLDAKVKDAVLQFVGVETVAEIPSGKYDQIIGKLKASLEKAKS